MGAQRSSAARRRPGGAGQQAVHLVGSIPLADSESVFRAVAAALADRISRIPDGETGVRSRWSSWTAPSYERTRGLEPVPPPPGNYTPWPQVRLVIDPAELVLERLGFADAAIASYRVFERLSEEGVIPAATRFQVCLPTPIAPMTVLIEERSRAGVEPAHVRQLHSEIGEILAAVPHERLTIQWDVCQDVGIWEGYYPAYFDDPQAGVIERLAACAQAVPEDVELGFHLCYGDYGHKHFMEPTDLATGTAIANRLAAAAPRTIDYLHLPVPIERDDDAFFAPLEGLDRQPGSELYLGLIHLADGVDGARRRLEAASRHVSGFGVATECGFGRRPPETIASLLALHADVAALLAAQ